MFSEVWRRGRIAALITICAAGVLAAAGTSTAAAASAGVSAASAGVPWSQVGPGWTLAEYTGGPQTTKYATTLYLISPAGAKYAVYTWRASKTAPPRLDAWSGDKTRALFSGPGAAQTAQIDLVTGKLSRFYLAGHAFAVGYTYPDGLNIVGINRSAGVWTLARYSLTGTLTKVLLRSQFAYAGLYSSNGTELAVPAADGVEQVSNAGGTPKQLPVPGANRRLGCQPERWWNTRTILVQCVAAEYNAPRLWLVPTSGAKPTALTTQRAAASHDLGDLNAWRLPSGLYLQSAGACGSLLINKQSASGSITPVTVPGTAANTTNAIVTAAGQDLLIVEHNYCVAGNSLLWFNPAAHTEKWLIRAPAYASLLVVAYNSAENAPEVQ
jgi:hypothetical protein